MTKTINIRGMLVGPDYDDPFLKPEIDKGVFCPSSFVLRQIDEAEADNSDLEIHIDSEGGDVFAYNAVSNRIRTYPGHVGIVIGSCAFSEAANLALTCGRPIYVHANSIMLWHSAMTTVYDGASGELKAEADILDRINAPIKKALIECGIPEEQVEEGFRDRCAIILGAEELVNYGIATLLDDEVPSAPKPDEATTLRMMELAEANQRIAAFHSKHSVNTIKPKATMKKSEEEIVLTEEEEKKVEENPTSEEKKETPCAEEPATVEEKPVEEETQQPSEEEKPEEGEPPELFEILEKLKENVEELTGRMSALEEKLTEKEVELEDAKKALKAERTKRIGAIAACVSGNAENAGPADWPAAVKSCKGDKLEAYKKYPDLAKAWTKSN